MKRIKVRRVTIYKGDVSQKTHDILSKHYKESSQKIHGRLKRAGAKILTPMPEVKTMARKKSERIGVPFVIDTRGRTLSNWLRRKQGMVKQSDAAIGRFSDGTYKVVVSPIVKYYPPSTVSKVMEHEIDHYRAFEKAKKRTKGRR